MRRSSILRTLAVVVLAAAVLQGCGPKNKTVTYANKAEKVVAMLHDPATKYVVVVAHRGDWRGNPENSIPAIESCIRMDVDMMELDLKLTKDSVLVLSHDWTLDRCTTGKGPISDYTFEEIQQFDLKDCNGEPRPGVKMPSLRQALEVCKDRIAVNVDQGFDYYDMVLAITEDLGVSSQILIKSGKPVAEAKASYSIGDGGMMYMPVVQAGAENAPQVVADYISVDRPLAFELCFGKLDDNIAKLCKDVTDSGSKLWINTLWDSLCGGYTDDKAFAAEDPGTVYGVLLDLGASIIQSDRPEFLIKYLEKAGRR